jgi:hypothetical protein
MCIAIIYSILHISCFLATFWRPTGLGSTIKTAITVHLLRGGRCVFELHAFDERGTERFEPCHEDAKPTRDNEHADALADVEP